MLRATLLLVLAAYCSAESLVPLFGWSNSDSLSAVPSGGSKVHDLLSKVKTNDITVAVVLKSNKLSFDDIAKYGGVYGEKNAPLSTLQSSLSSSKSSLSTGVSGQPASDLITYLTFAMATQPVYVTGVSQFPEFDSSHQYVLVVELPEGNEEETTFRTHDAIISKTVATLSDSNLPYAIFYTSDRSSTPTYKQPLTSSYTRRSASIEAISTSNEDSSKLCFNILEGGEDHNCTNPNSTEPCTTCLLFCLSTMMTYDNIIQMGNETIKVTAIANSTDSFNFRNGSCNTTVAEYDDLWFYNSHYSYFSIDVDFVEVVDNATKEAERFTQNMVFGFANGECNTGDGYNDTACGFWTMQILIKNVSNDSNSKFFLYEQLHQERIYSPFAVPISRDPRSRLSYACGNNIQNNFTSVSSMTNQTIQLAGIQVQPFAALTAKGLNPVFFFGSAYNCQGYFGTVSWMGIVAVLILILIMYISIVFVFSIQNIDRFDDPRGETIKVENLH